MKQKPTKEFLNKGWKLRELNKLSKMPQKLAPRQSEAAALKAYRISLLFLLRNIHT